jgi:hypothetical protein
MLFQESCRIENSETLLNIAGRKRLVSYFIVKLFVLCYIIIIVLAIMIMVGLL